MRKGKMNHGSLIIILSVIVVAASAAVLKRGTCIGNCAAQKENGRGNSLPTAGVSPGGSGGSTNNGNNNGNCRGNCVGNMNGNFNGNNNINSNRNGNANGNCGGNCFHNKVGNKNGNNNTNVDNNGNSNGNCWGNCFYRVGGNNIGNNNRGPLTPEAAINGFIEETVDSKNNKDNCFGNCFSPQPMGKTANYDAEFNIAKSPLQCSRVDGYSFYIMPETYCLEIYRYPTKQSPPHGQLPQFACPPGTVLDLDICGCNHWFIVNLYKTCRSSYQEFNG